MGQVDLDFKKYIEQRQGGQQGHAEDGAPYAYAGDQKVLRTLGRVKPVTLAVEATVRLWKGVTRGQILGSAVKVTDKQFPDIHALVVDCSRRLQIAPPSVYVAPEVGTLNAHTFGTRDDAYIVLNGILVDHLEREELGFVIGHECGHIHNNHVVYITALYYLMYSANVFLRWIVQPAVVALQSWARRAEITCDRAGLLCAGSPEAATKALVKLALGSRKLAKQVDVGEYLKQLEESQQGIGGVAELLQSHPYLPKRVAALQAFAETHYWLRAQGLTTSATEGKSLQWCDEEVSRLLRVMADSADGGPKESGDAD